MRKRTIPIVLASDENYILPTYVAIHSLLKVSDKADEYRVFVLCPGDISEYGMQMIKALEKTYSNSVITFVDMGKRFSELKMKISHITFVTYYRLCLPEVLKDYEKCIYLDSDIVVCRNLASLYDMDMENDYLAGVLSEGIQRDKYYQRELCKLIGLKDVSTYVNAGVLLMNLKKLREDCLMQKWMQLSEKAFPTQDQDVLNTSCYGKMKLLPLKYNTMPKTKSLCAENHRNKVMVYTPEEIEEAKIAPVIIHYADFIKPWNDAGTPMASFWWDVVKSIEDDEIQQRINSFSQSLPVRKKSKKTVMKQRIIRMSQIMGLYAILKHIEEPLRRNKGKS